jgi:hypothetical protein
MHDFPYEGGQTLRWVSHYGGSRRRTTFYYEGREILLNGWKYAFIDVDSTYDASDSIAHCLISGQLGGPHGIYEEIRTLDMITPDFAFAHRYAENLVYSAICSP